MPALTLQLVHATVQSLEALLQRVTRAHAAFALRDIGAQALAGDALTAAAAHAATHGPVTLAETLASLRAQFAAITRGRDPLTGARMPTPMREMQQLLMDGALRDAGSLLRDRLRPQLLLLDDGRDQMGTALLASLQSRLLTTAELMPRPTIDACVALWARLCTDPQIALLNVKLRLTLHPSDLTLLFFDRWSALQVRPVPSADLGPFLPPGSQVPPAQTPVRAARGGRVVLPTR